jgi:tRNA-splicing ligase RtcB
VLDLPLSFLDKDQRRDQLADSIETQTRFGVGAEFAKPHEHAVMDRDWSVSPITRDFRARAWKQLGTSGSGNHFVEFGLLTVPDSSPRGIAQTSIGGSHARWDLAPGEYVALLSHSGSRGTGAAVCSHYSRLASSLRPHLRGEAGRLAWLDLDSQQGHEYWEAMTLMGDYAAANHAIIHQRIIAHLGAAVLADVENHHNFAWKETHDIRSNDGTIRREEVIVHRKGATPASDGVLGVIPGSMGTPGFVVRGKGSVASLASAAHGAGRVMSRTKAREKFRISAVRGALAKQGITVLSAGSDESPGVYKDIHRVMSMQHDLVDAIARFDPKIVKMAPEGERAED